MAGPDTSGDSTRSLAIGAAAAVVVLCGFQFWSGDRIERSLDAQEARTKSLEVALASLEETAVGLEKAALALGNVDRRLERMEERLKPLEIVGDEWEFVVPDIQKVITELGELRGGIEQTLGVRLGENLTPQPPQLDWTAPELFEAAKKAAAGVGIQLTEDEIRVPGRLAVREGILEYFAVLKGGKEHEALISLVGNTPEDQRHAPAEFAVKLNNAIQALGFKPGRPLRFTPRGPIPAEGETIYLFIELEIDGEQVLARAEDLVWNRLTGKPMERGKWVYVGSRFSEDEPGELVFVADLTGEVVATYSTQYTIIDNLSEGAADDTVFLAATPRIPEGVKDMTLVIRREDRDDTHRFPDPPPPSEDAEDGSAEEGGGAAEDEDQGARTDR